MIDLSSDTATRPTRAMRLAIAEGIAGLLGHRDFTYVVQSAAGNNRQREALLFQRLDALAAAGR